MHLCAEETLYCKPANYFRVAAAARFKGVRALMWWVPFSYRISPHNVFFFECCNLCTLCTSACRSARLHQHAESVLVCMSWLRLKQSIYVWLQCWWMQMSSPHPGSRCNWCLPWRRGCYEEVVKLKPSGPSAGPSGPGENSWQLADLWIPGKP